MTQTITASGGVGTVAEKAPTTVIPITMGLDGPGAPHATAELNGKIVWNNETAVDVLIEFEDAGAVHPPSPFVVTHNGSESRQAAKRSGPNGFRYCLSEIVRKKPTSIIIIA
jgi:hypothetical protein